MNDLIWKRIGKALMAALMASSLSSAWAGLSVYTDGTSSPPNPAANQRTIDFDTTTLATEQAASKITYSASAGAATCPFFICNQAGSISYTSSSSLSGFSSNVLSLTSGTTPNTTSLTVNFVNPTPYVGFLWGAQFVSENDQVVNLTLADNSVVTLKNCKSIFSNQCMGTYVSTNWLTDLNNALFGWIFGDSVTYYSTYVQYQPSNGLKIKSIQFVSSKCAGCGFLSADTSQDFKIDKLTYVDGSVAPDHLEVTTSSTGLSSGVNTTYTIKACGNATCSLPYINGVTGNLSLTGTGLTATYPSGAAFTIAAGPTNTTTVTASVSPAGTATVALTGLSSTPTNATKTVFCGIGVTATSSTACTASVVGLHHLEVTTGSSGGTLLSAVAYTIKACGDAACSVTYTGGVTGTINFAGVTMTTPLSGSSAFSITAGNSTTTVSATPATAGTMTASLSGVSPVPSGSPAVYCGIGGAAASGNTCGYSVGLSLHHLEVTTSSATNVTCAPITYTIKACSDASCATPYTGVVAGTLLVSGVTVPTYTSGSGVALPGGIFSFSGGSMTINAQATTVGTATASVAGLLPSASVYCGMGASASSSGSCAVSTVDTALQMVVSNHKSDLSQSVTLSAVQSTNNATMCAPLFGNVTLPITMKCNYVNPTTGTRAVRVAGVALNAANNANAACDATGQAVSLSFNGSGVASTTLQYGDVGQVGMTLSFSGTNLSVPLPSLSAVGSLNFTTFPASFSLTGLPSTFVAGSNFSATLTALNNSGGAVPNFGKETVAVPDLVRITWAKTAPTGTGAASGIFTGKGTSSSNPISSASFVNGVVSLTDLNWTEVGQGTLSVALVGTSYLGVVTSVVGSTVAGAVGPFVPHHFDQVLTQPCSTFTYSGQPLSLLVQARNALGALTVNYDGTANFSKDLILSLNSGGSSGTFSSTGALASAFGAGQATIPTTFTFNSKLTPPITSTLRVVENVAGGVSSALGSEQTLTVRSGRLKVSNAFAADNKSSLDVPVQVQYWNGKTWAINSMDSCTKIPVASIARSNYLDHKGSPTTAWTTTPVQRVVNGIPATTDSGLPAAVVISGGNGVLTLGAPTPAAVGSVDFAFNLGAGSTDQSCLGTHPTSTGANLLWLQALNGGANACAGVTTYDRDPGARATFGVYKPESKKAVFSRDVY